LLGDATAADVDGFEDEMKQVSRLKSSSVIGPWISTSLLEKNSISPDESLASWSAGYVEHLPILKSNY